ncbi:MAG TPA: hypothetical protein VF600_07665 [Abditibacteriaceae bacterium]
MDAEQNPKQWDKKSKQKVIVFFSVLLVYLALCTAGSAWALSVRYAGSGLSNSEIFVRELPVLIKGFIVAIPAVYFWEWYFTQRKKKK